MAPYYLWRMRKRGGYRDGFENRWGKMPRLPEKRRGVRRIWLQAVSVGELLAIAPLLKALNERADVEVFLSTTTSTGYRVARERYADLVIGVAYFPLDFWLFSARVWGTVRADLTLLMEGERWPEHIYQARRCGAMVMAVNARLSDRSFARMQGVRGLVPLLMGGIDRLLAVSAEDAERFRALGFDGNRVAVVGNLKVDNEITLIDDTAKAALRKELGFAADDQILLGSSLWAGEEEVLLGIWQTLRQSSAAGARLKLLLVPRHAERRAEVEALVQRAEVAYNLRSRGPAAELVEVSIADTTGELQRLTQVADVVFVGKSLPPHREGQTPIEAAGLGRPLVFGPGMASFRSIAVDLVKTGAAIQVANADELNMTLAKLVDDAGGRNRMAEAGRSWHQASRGALERTMDSIVWALKLSQPTE